MRMLVALACHVSVTVGSLKYRIERTTGKGGMATVYLARSPESKVPVALKILTLPGADLEDDPQKTLDLPTLLALERFWREARIMQSLDCNTAHMQSVHQNLLAAYDAERQAKKDHAVTRARHQVRLRSEAHLLLADVSRLQ